ncbi:hypothetical protein PoB_002200900, partial [Plakobranchus ocellatus]
MGLGRVGGTKASESVSRSSRIFPLRVCVRCHHQRSDPMRASKPDIILFWAIDAVGPKAGDSLAFSEGL